MPTPAGPPTFRTKGSSGCFGGTGRSELRVQCRTFWRILPRLPGLRHGSEYCRRFVETPFGGTATVRQSPCSAQQLRVPPDFPRECPDTPAFSRHTPGQGHWHQGRGSGWWRGCPGTRELGTVQTQPTGLSPAWGPQEQAPSSSKRQRWGPGLGGTDHVSEQALIQAGTHLWGVLPAWTAAPLRGAETGREGPLLGSLCGKTYCPRRPGRDKGAPG